MPRQLEQQYQDLLMQNQKLEAQVVALQQKLATCKEEAERLRRAMDTAQMGYWELDLATNTMIGDEQHEKLFGLTPGSFAGTYEAFLALIHPDDRDMVKQTIQRAVVENIDPRTEFRLLWPSGEVRWMNAQGRLLHDSAGQPTRISGGIRDITERKRTEATLARYQLLSENTRDIVLFIRAADGRIVEANQAAVAVYGYDHATLLTKSISDLRDPTTLGALPEQMRQADTNGILFETRHCRKDGASFPVEVSARGADVGGERLLLSIVRDVTERKQAEEALRRSRERLQMVLRAGRMGWWERDVRTNETTWSDSLYDLLGQGSQANRPSYELFLQRVHPDDRQKVQDRVRQAIDERGEYSAEYRLLHPNGGTRWVLEKGRIFYDQTTHSQRIVGVSLDITQRKWVEEGLRESEAILRSVYDNTPLLLGLVEISEDDILHLYDNPAMHRFYGLPAPQSTTGRWASALGMPPAAIQEWLDHFKASEASKQPVQFEYVHNNPDAPRWLAVTVALIGPGFSGRTHFCYVAEDVTERKRVEKTLRESEQRYRELADAMPQIVYTAGPDGVGTYVNQQWQQYTGISEEQMPNFDWSTLLHPDDRQATVERWSESLQTGEPLTAEYRLKYADGKYRWHITRTVPVRNESGQIIEWIGTSTNIHERKLVEEALWDLAERLQLALDAGRMTAFEWHQASDQVRRTENASTVLGMGVEDTGQNYFQIVHPEDRPAFLALLAKLSPENGYYQFEYRIIRPDTGVTVWLQERARAIFSESGQLTRLTGLVMDITERKRIEIGQDLLAEAGRLLALSLNVTDRLVELAEIGVKVIAEWCAVNLIEGDGTIRLMAAAHREPAKTALIYKLAQRYPVDLTAPTRTPDVLRTGQGRLYTDLFQALPASRAEDPEYRLLLAQLGGQTIIIAPLIAREQVLGSITCVSRPGQYYDGQDLALIEELARRAALAVDNARLYEAGHDE